MRRLERRLRQIVGVFVLTAFLTALPVMTAWASQPAQSIPTMAPDTSTPTNTSVSNITNTPVHSSGSPASTNTATAVPFINGFSQTLTFEAAQNTATSLATNPVSTVTFTPLPPTITVSPIVLTQTLTGNTDLASPTVELTLVAQNTVTMTPVSPQGPGSFDNGSFLLGAGALFVILAVYLVARGRNRGTGSS